MSQSQQRHRLSAAGTGCRIRQVRLQHCMRIMPQILEGLAMQLTNLATALDGIDSRTIRGYVVIKAVIDQVQVAYSRSTVW